MTEIDSVACANDKKNAKITDCPSEFAFGPLELRHSVKGSDWTSF